MGYDKLEAFKRLKIPTDLQNRILIIIVFKWICWLARKTHLVYKCSAGLYNSTFNLVVVFAGDSLAENDYTLAHEIFGHKKKHKKFEKIAQEEAHAVEEGLLAIRSLHRDFYDNSVKRIEKYQTEGAKSPWKKLIGHFYHAQVNLKRLK